MAVPAFAGTAAPAGSWSSQAKVPNVTSSYAPAETASSSKVYLAYTTSSGGIDYVTHTTAGWGTAKSVSGKSVAPTTTSAPAITIFDGDLYVFWINSSGDLRYTDLVGTTWAASKTVSGKWGTATSSTTPSVTVASAELWVAWKSKSNDDIFYSSFGGTSWAKQQLAVSDATSLSPTITPTGLSAAPLAFAWTTASHSIEYGILGFLGFETIGTVPSAGTNAAPALDFMPAAPGETMYLAWKGTNTNKVFFDDVTDFSGSSFSPSSWAGQATLPSALTSAGPALTEIGTTLYVAYKGHTTDNIWYEDASAPTS